MIPEHPTPRTSEVELLEIQNHSMFCSTYSFVYAISDNLIIMLKLLSLVAELTARRFVPLHLKSYMPEILRRPMQPSF